MSKSRQHWQEDSSDYTFNQYTFYLIVLGLMIAGLIFWYINRVIGDPVPKTHFVSIVSQQGSDLPTIPYQDEDFAAIKNLVPDAVQYTFDDIISFNDEIKKLKKRSEDFQEIDTVMIWLSAVGSVDEGKPVVLGSEPVKRVGFETLITSLEELNAENVVLMLDCNHGCVNSNAYTDKSVAEDFNLFPNLVADTLKSHSGKVKVMLYGLKGEKPLHSFLRRRTLFGLAIENAFLDREEKEWDGGGFVNAIDSLCQTLADKSAPQLKWLGDDALATKFRLPILNKPDPEDEEEDSEKKKEFVIDKVAKKAIDKTNRTWKAYEKVKPDLTKKQTRELGGENPEGVHLSPVTVDPVLWHKLNQDMAGLSAIALRSASEHLKACSAMEIRCNDFDSNSNLIESIVSNLDLIEVPPEFELSPIEQEQRDTENAKRDVALKFQHVHEILFRIQHYVAVADSLSWILPGNDTVYGRYCENLLIKRLESAELENEIWNLPKPSLDQQSRIDELYDKAKELEKLLEERMANLGRSVVPQLKGLQQEMAVEAILRLPFLPVESPFVPEGEDVNESELPSREMLVDLILDSDSDNPNPDKRYSSGDRENSSKIRIGMYKQQKLVFEKVGVQNDASRGLQVFAYRLAPVEYDFERFTVLDRTATPIVKVNNLKLLQKGVFIERDPTPIDLGLTVENTSVDLLCTIIQRKDENGNRFFGFPGSDEDQFTFDGTTQPQLVAFRNSTGMEATFSCRLQIKIVDKTDPTNVLFEPFDFPIKLPSQNQIELLVDFGSQPTTFRKDSDSGPIQPFANRELLCNFGIRNQWHQARNGKLHLYACASPGTPTIAGKINQEVRQITLDALQKDQLQPIAESTFSLPGVNNEEAQTQKIKWALPTGVEEALPLSADHGFLLVIDNDTVEEDWHYWVPVFPRQLPVVEVIPDVQSDNLKIGVKRASFFPKKYDTKIRWYFKDFGDLGEGSLAVGKDSDEFAGAKTISQRFSGPGPHYLYVDVDGWPRKYVFKYNGNQFVPAPSTNDAGIEIMLGSPGDKPPKEDPLVLLEAAPGFDRVYGTRQEAKNVTVQLSPNVPSMSAFSFSRAQDHIQLGGNTNNKGKLFYPRRVQTKVELAPKKGNLILSSNVSDHELTFDILGDRFNIGPSLKLGDNPAQRLTGDNRIQIQIDNQPPSIDAAQCRVITSEIYPGRKVSVRLKVKDEGVGINMKSGVELFLSETDDNLTDLKNKVAAMYVKDGVYQFTAPKATGKYKVGVRLKDLVGNQHDSALRNNVSFKVNPPKNSSSVNGGKKKVFKHSLTVTVSATATEISNLADLDVKIKPEDGSSEANGDKFTFRNLKEGVSYTVTASGKLASGFAKGRKLSGKTSSYSFPKGAKSSKNAQLKLKMK